MCVIDKTDSMRLPRSARWGCTCHAIGMCVLLCVHAGMRALLGVHAWDACAPGHAHQGCERLTGASTRDAHNRKGRALEMRTPLGTLFLVRGIWCFYFG